MSDRWSERFDASRYRSARSALRSAVLLDRRGLFCGASTLVGVGLCIAGQVAAYLINRSGRELEVVYAAPVVLLGTALVFTFPFRFLLAYFDRGEALVAIVLCLVFVVTPLALAGMLFAGALAS